MLVTQKARRDQGQKNRSGLLVVQNGLLHPRLLWAKRSNFDLISAVLQTEELPSVLPAVPRVIAVGDLHGDLQKTRRAFQLAGLINDQDRWIGGSTTVVQVSF